MTEWQTPVNLDAGKTNEEIRKQALNDLRKNRARGTMNQYIKDHEAAQRRADR